FLQYAAIPSGNVAVMTSSREMAMFSTAALTGTSGEVSLTVSNLIVGALSAKLNDENLEISSSKIGPSLIRELAGRIVDGTLSNSTAVGQVIPALWSG